MNDRTINVELTTTNVFTRWPCHVCGGYTEKVEVLAESRPPSGGPYMTSTHQEYDQIVRVCERCLESGNIDERLASHANYLEALADETRALIGRLKVPTFAEWQAYSERVEAARYASYVSDDDSLYERVMADDATFNEWRKRHDEERIAEVASVDAATTWPF